MGTIGMSAGKRQKLAGKMMQDIKTIRDILDHVEKEILRFDDDSNIIYALNDSLLAEAVARLTYRAGEVNGALALPDLFNGRDAQAEAAGKEGESNERIPRKVIEVLPKESPLWDML